MPRQQRLDGFDIDADQARFVGTFDLEQEDLPLLELDRVAFLVVAARVKDVNFKSLETGDHKRIDVLEIQDARVATGELRDSCVEWLMGKSSQQFMDFRARNGVASEEEKAEEAAFARVRPPGVDDNGEVVATSVGESVPGAPGPPSSPESLSPTDVGEEDDLEELPEDQVPQFSPTSVERVVYAERKDKTLAEFMQGA